MISEIAPDNIEFALRVTLATANSKKAILVKVGHDAEDIEEIEELAKTAGAFVVDSLTQKRDEFNPSSLLGKGKVQELNGLIAQHKVNCVIFDNNLSPAQIRNLEGELKIPVMDRTELILDIFATHAKTSEAKLQVELARLKYELPRLVGRKTGLEQIQAGSPQAVGALGMGMRGPGERQIEYDRRLLRRRIYELGQKIKEVEKRRELLVSSRAAENFTVSLVGYTNAGKSTLMNLLTRSGVYVDDRLFSTLDTKTKLWKTKSGAKVLLSDTVGFIKNLPAYLVSSFYATLEEVRQSDLLLHVVDMSDSKASERIEIVNKTLENISAGGIEKLIVFNKIDVLEDKIQETIFRRKYPESIFISALKGMGIELLEELVEEKLLSSCEELKLKLPVSDGKLYHELSADCQVLEKKFDTDWIVVKAKVPKRVLYKFEKFIVLPARLKKTR